MKISQKTVDFVICLKNFEVVAAIELDDSSHNHPNAKRRDQDKEKALNDAGVKLIRYNVKELPSIEEISKRFTE